MHVFAEITLSTIYIVRKMLRLIMSETREQSTLLAIPPCSGWETVVTDVATFAGNYRDSVGMCNNGVN